MDELLPLNLMNRGDSALIEEVLGDCDQVHRLEELGLRTGVAVEMLEPGVPCIVRIGDQKLCFRSADLFNVIVRPGVPS